MDDQSQKPAGQTPDPYAQFLNAKNDPNISAEEFSRLRKAGTRFIIRQAVLAAAAAELIGTKRTPS